MSLSHTPRVERARPPEINDRQLRRLCAIAHNAKDGNVSEAEAEWVLSCAGPLFDELAERRQVDAELADQLLNAIPHEDRVIYLQPQTEG